MKGKQKTITILKQKILEMKNELNQAVSYPTFRKVQPSPKKLSPSPIKRQPMDYYQKQKIPSIYRCSSFVNNSTSTSKNIERSASIQRMKLEPEQPPNTQQPSRQEISPISKPNLPLTKSSKSNIRKSPIKNPQLSKVLKNIDNKFYLSIQQNSSSLIEKQNPSPAKQLKPNNSVATFDTSDRVEKKRTYNLKRTDPILNPQQAPVNKRRAVIKPQLSPSKLFYEAHPKSNLNLHIFGEKEIILQRKGNLSRQRNKSSIDLLTDEPDPLPSRPQRKNRKHYPQILH